MKEYFNQEFLGHLERLVLRIKKLKSGTKSGDRRSLRKGHSVEFTDFRNYTPGDDVRYTDWNSYARSQKLFIKLFVEEQNVLITIFLDMSKSMSFGEPPKEKLARQLAGAFAYIILSGYDQLCLAGCIDHINQYLSPVRGKAAVKEAWDFLDRLDFTGTTDLNKALQDFGRYFHRPGLSIVVSDLLSSRGFKEGLKYLQYLKQEVVLVQILAPDEINPSLFGDMRLIDSETGHVQEITISSNIVREYQKRLRHFTDDTRAFCYRRGIPFIQLTSNEHFDDIILHKMLPQGILE